MSEAGERGWIVALVAGAAVLVVGVLAIAGVFSGDGEGDVPAASDFGEISTESAAAPPRQPAVRRIEVGGRPDAIAAGGGYIWVGDSFAGTVKRLNPASKKPIPVEPAGFPTDVAGDGGGAWLALPDRGAVQRLSADEGAAEPVKVKGFPFQIAAGEDAVWAMAQSELQRIDPSGEPGPLISLGGEGASVAAGEGSVWVARDNREVIRIDPQSGEIAGGAAAIPGAFNVAVGEGAAWTLGAAGTLTRLDPADGQPAGGPVQVSDALDVAAGLGYVWVASATGGVVRFDPKSGQQAGEPIDVGPLAQALTVGEGSVWVADARDGGVYRVTP